MHKEMIGQTELTFRRIDAPELLEEIYRLRYQVYCKECEFIREEDYPAGMERDKYDPHSIHFVTEDAYGIIGTMRLIMDSPLGFPFEEHCEGKLSMDVNKLPRKQIAEVSRLVISKNFRRRDGDGMYYTPDFDENETTANLEGVTKRVRPMAFGMYRELYQESKRIGVTHWVGIMEKSLWLLLRMHSFIFHPIGEEIDFYGKVRPYLATITELEQALYQRSPKFTTEYFLDGLEEQYRPKFNS
jgi:N-acyl amino acid synthase of PEP-CTERM/exosortase system